MFLYHKKRRNRECHFGFVQFEYLKDARKAVRDLNGISIRGKGMMISFAKYDRNRKPWNTGEDHKWSEELQRGDPTCASPATRGSLGKEKPQNSTSY